MKKMQGAALIMSLVLVAIMSACGPAPTTVWEPTATPTLVPPTATPTAVPAKVPTATPEPGTTWVMPLFGIALRLPPGWLPQEGHDQRYAGPDGFFQVGAISAEGLTIAEVAENLNL